MRLGFLGVWLTWLTAAAATAPPDGLQISVRESFPGVVQESTEYIVSDRARTEWRTSLRTPHGPVEHSYAQIRRCDRNSVVILDDATRTYLTSPLHVRSNVVERAASWLWRRPVVSQSTAQMVVETTTVDTGERKIAFGYSARRVITTRRQSDSGNARSWSETVTDGWYIDLDTQLPCERLAGPGAVLIGVASRIDAGADHPRVMFKQSGKPENGFPIETRRTSRFPGSAQSAASAYPVTHRVITQLSRRALDASLFEIPPGFHPRERLFSGLAAQVMRTASIVRSAVVSWFR